MKRWLLAAIFASTATIASAQDDVVHHDLDVSIDPANGALRAVDTVTVPADLNNNSLRFHINSDLALKSLTPGVTLSKQGEPQESTDIGIDREDFVQGTTPILVQAYAVSGLPAAGAASFAVEFSGTIHYVIEQIGEEYARGFSQSLGIIEERGAYLAGSTHWVPYFEDRLITYDMTVNLPSGWSSVGQGDRAASENLTGGHRDKWTVKTPTEEVHLIAAPFETYEFPAGAVTAMAFLRRKDDSLAQTYLETTAQYLDMYRELIGPYPYSKFALVENFWETGYGMPSFTLLGEQVIRFPFILHSSYPHELLHNWWGNGVFVDFESGNWCEGLTTYMADHLVAEQRGQGSEYRRDLLQRYSDYVPRADDFPLTDFRTRYNPVTEAVGYGKTAMVWDMLRLKVGDAAFIAGFKAFYEANRFQVAGFDDIREAFEETTGLPLRPFFQQWIERSGSPELILTDVRSTLKGDSFELNFTLSQIQPDDAYELEVPVAVYTRDDVEVINMRMSRKSQPYTLFLDSEPVAVAVDPPFNIFRRLHNNEIPPALSKAFGADSMVFVLPSKASPEEVARYEGLIQAWSVNREDKVEVVRDNALDKLPADKAVWILGWDNRFKFEVAAALENLDASIDDDAVHLGTTSYSRADHSFVVVTRNPTTPTMAAVWVTAATDKDAEELAGKLPHYGKYSYLAFTGPDVANVAKGQWPAVDSPLYARVTDAVQSLATLAERSALTELHSVFSAERMLEDVTYLASDELEGRGLATPGIDAAAEYIADRFKQLGLEPAGDEGTYFQTFEVAQGPNGTPVSARNVIAALPGSDATRSEESLVLSAHYDHLGRGWPDVREGNEGQIHNGADDNASGVALILELARILKDSGQTKRPIVFIAFSAEEAGLLGSRHYAAAAAKYSAAKAVANLNFDTVGRLEGGKVQILGGATAKEWPVLFMTAGDATGIQSDLLKSEINASDNVAFVEKGVPAVQFFASVSGDYHRPTDDADKVDGAGLVKIATLARELTEQLANRESTLEFVQPTSSIQLPTSDEDRRKVSTGTIPDMTFAGPGVRLNGVGEASPAAAAGLFEGDIIIKMDDVEVANLGDFTNVLRGREPGEELEIVYLRNGEEHTATIVLAPR